MAAAEYYNAGPLTTAQPPSYRPPQNLQELPGSPHFYASSTPSSASQAPPPYQPIQQSTDSKPNVHFAPAHNSSQQQFPAPGTYQHKPTYGPPGSSQQAPSPQFRPAVPQQPAPHNPQLLRPPHPQQHANSYHGAPAPYAPPHMRPYMNGNQSQYSLNNGYSSDPESRRRRRRRHSHNSEKSDREARLADRTDGKHSRSRSTNTDGFLGAAGGGIIGDMIFPGLGTVGGVVAGWLGGKDYGKHRKHKEVQRDKEQMDWERKHRDRSSGDERKYDRHVRRESFDRRRSDY